MFEKVNPSHPDKVADRIAGAIVDLAYSKKQNPKVACEVLIGHGKATIINETDTPISVNDVEKIVQRITESRSIEVEYIEVKQDEHLNQNQVGKVRCGDNGIFKGTPMTNEQLVLTCLAGMIYKKYPSDGKYLVNGNNITVCQSKADAMILKNEIAKERLLTDNALNKIKINPLGYWTGGTNVDTGATNRKLGSDMGDGVTGGGLHGKDLSKADVTINTWLFLIANEEHKTVEATCSIGDEYVIHPITKVRIPYGKIVEVVAGYIKTIGGFEKFAEWGLLRPEHIKISKVER